MTDRFWVPLFRCCKVSDERVAVSPPILFGRGYVYDRSSQTVSVTLAILRVPFLRVQIPFRDITDLTLTRVEVEKEYLLNEYGDISYQVIAISARDPVRQFTVAMEQEGWGVEPNTSSGLR